MCGIAGFVTTEPYREADSLLRAMTDAIAHRGPDASGYYRDAHAALGHRRLSIIDLSTGQQPMANEDDRLKLIYNGEIFNHADVRPELERAGHRYKSHSDSETILHSYEQWGPECLHRFRGMFAFVIWDKQSRKLFAARDRLGIKPFYYFWNGRLFAFASEIKALLKHPAISASVEEDLIPEYLGFGFASEERTLVRGIRKLMPGHHLTLDLQTERPEPAIRRYWDVPATQHEERDDASWIAECRQRLEETVRMRLMSDVPLGMFLSGGVDSSAIAALMRRLTSSPVKTFSVGYREAAFSELEYARQVASLIGADHHEVTVSMEDFFDALPRLIWHEDEPITWPSSVSLFFVSKLASEHVKVVLTGEGSDELFGGYERYGHYLFNSRWMKRYRMAPAPLRRLVRSQLSESSLLSGDLRRKLKHTFLGREDSFESLQLDNFYCAFDAKELAAWRRPASPLDASGMYRNVLRYFDQASDRSPLAQMLYTDQKTYLVELLMKQDQMSMAASIESRVPFLDHHFVDFAMRLPDRLKIRNGEAKFILKKAVEDLLPPEIIYRKKMGFPTPLRQWFRESRAEPLFAGLVSGTGLVANYLDLHRVKALLERHRAGAEDATDRIWRLLNLQIWGDTILEGRGEQWEHGAIAAAADR